ncbi:uncharacterized protein M6B38_271445 [Iris pallida]|uniref:Uncharacterized protein n=1 Tax=Iris pallida TaxID=29817 RepID=A0AAX6I844_IRIPA|nr:uncharacterized protein M6B38_271445 [Iris pallida]
MDFWILDPDPSPSPDPGPGPFFLSLSKPGYF